MLFSSLSWTCQEHEKQTIHSYLCSVDKRLAVWYTLIWDADTEPTWANHNNFRGLPRPPDDCLKSMRLVDRTESDVQGLHAHLMALIEKGAL